MTNLSVIENKISSIKKIIKILKKLKKYSKNEIKSNLIIRGAVERYLYLLAQTTIDLAEAFISYKKFRKPITMSDTFNILNEEDVIPNRLTEKMISMVGFRNIIAHAYEKIDYDIVYEILQNKLRDVESFIKVISKIINVI